MVLPGVLVKCIQETRGWGLKFLSQGCKGSEAFYTPAEKDPCSFWWDLSCLRSDWYQSTASSGILTASAGLDVQRESAFHASWLYGRTGLLWPYSELKLETPITQGSQKSSQTGLKVKFLEYHHQRRKRLHILRRSYTTISCQKMKSNALSSLMVSYIL